MDNMEIKERVENRVGILSIDGDIVIRTINELKPLVQKYIEQEDLKGIIFDCTGVGCVDSVGLGLFASVYRRLDKTDRKLAFSSINSRLMGTFTFTSLSSIFILSKDIPMAIAAINEGNNQ